MRTAKAPKPNIEALQDAVFKINPDAIVIYGGANGIDIQSRDYSLTVDEILSFSFRLYGTHNKLEVTAEGGLLVLHGATYRLLPEFLIEGEEVEFQISD